MTRRHGIPVHTPGRRAHQAGSITTEYVVVSLFVAMMAWAAIVGVEWETPHGEAATDNPSVSGAMRDEYEDYADVIARQ